MTTTTVSIVVGWCVGTTSALVGYVTGVILYMRVKDHIRRRP